MQVKVGSFPAVYVNVSCKRHQCPVDIKIEPSMRYMATEPTGVQITSMKCKDGGQPSNEYEDCTSEWEATMLFNGDLTVGL